MKGLTQRQRAVLGIIHGSMAERGYPPTIREIGEELGIRSTNGVNDHLKALERKGYLYRESSKSRAIRLVIEDGADVDLDLLARGAEDDDGMLEVPLIGRIAAGVPILAEENHERTFRVDAAMLGARARPSQVFLLKVHGESMIDEGICHGDLIFVERTSEARQGEIVAAMVDGEATVKRFFRRGRTLVLEPANQTMKPLEIHESDGRDASIIGRVIGVFRTV
jgi:repressor LexA